MCISVSHLASTHLISLNPLTAWGEIPLGKNDTILKRTNINLIFSMLHKQKNPAEAGFPYFLKITLEDLKPQLEFVWLAQGLNLKIVTKFVTWLET